MNDRFFRLIFLFLLPAYLFSTILTFLFYCGSLKLNLDFRRLIQEVRGPPIKVTLIGFNVSPDDPAIVLQQEFFDCQAGWLVALTTRRPRPSEKNKLEIEVAA